jgi:hypothetical protein
MHWCFHVPLNTRLQEQRNKKPSNALRSPAILPSGDLILCFQLEP